RPVLRAGERRPAISGRAQLRQQAKSGAAPTLAREPRPSLDDPPVARHLPSPGPAVRRGRHCWSLTRLRACRMISDLWYKNAIIYCLSVGTYMDANGDGIGDFRGLERRLDYLHVLGVTAIWLMPFQTSPHRDDGYDIADYYSVDQRYGTLGDFVDFTRGAKQRGIRVLIDLVVNHTSDQHPWFREARSDPQSKYRACSVWSKS